MAEKKTYADVLSEGKIGNYDEAPGGGTGSNKNFHVAHTQEEADAYKEAHPGAAVRVDQPRKENGQFTYNSANAKTLKYGPSRGTTVPPFLENIKMTYAVKTGDKIVSEEGGKKHVYLNNLNFDVDSLIKAFKEYDLNKGFGEFSQEIKKKKGALSKAEKGTSGLSILSKEDLSVTLQKVKEHYKGETKKFAVKKTTPAQPKPEPESKVEEVKPNPTQAEAPKAEVKKDIPAPPEPPKVQQEIGAKQYAKQEKKAWNVEDATKNKEQFIKDNYKELKEIADMAKQAGLKLSSSALFGLIANPKFDTFEKVKQAVQTAIDLTRNK